MYSNPKKKYNPYEEKEPTNILPIKSKPVPSLPDLVEELELSGGNLDTFLVQYRGLEHRLEKEQLLFSIYQDLELEENKEHKKRWQAAIDRSAQIRFDLLQCKAFRSLENFSSQTEKSSSPEVSFCKLVLDNRLQERVASFKQPKQTQFQPTDEPDEIDKDILMLTGTGQ